MGLAQSPKIVTDGLIFYYDQNNVKSLAGPAIQNLAFTRAVNTQSGTGISVSGGYEIVDVPQVGQSNTVYANIQNNYTAFSPNSGDCCPSPIYYINPGPYGFTVSPSTLYTYAIVYKVNSGYTNANYMYRYEYTASGGSYVTEGGVHSDSNRIHLGGGWYWAWGTFTTQATTNWIGYHGAFYYRYSNRTDKLSVAKVLIARGDYTTLHPKYWPADNTTRSSTQSLLDLTNRNTITSTNLTYASNGSFSFVRANSPTVATNLPVTSLPALSNFSLSVWLNITALPSVANNNGVIFGATFYSGTAIYWYSNGTTFTIYGYIRGADDYRVTNSYTLPLNTVHHIVLTNDYFSGTLNLYVNGDLFSSVATATQQYNPSLTADAGNIGVNKPQIDGGGSNVYTYFTGIVYSAAIHNKALTGAEVRQNFNAHRGRYGI